MRRLFVRAVVTPEEWNRVLPVLDQTLLPQMFGLDYQRLSGGRVRTGGQQKGTSGRPCWLPVTSAISWKTCAASGTAPTTSSTPTCTRKSKLTPRVSK